LIHDKFVVEVDISCEEVEDDVNCEANIDEIVQVSSERILTVHVKTNVHWQHHNIKYHKNYNNYIP